MRSCWWTIAGLVVVVMEELVCMRRAEGARERRLEQALLLSIRFWDGIRNGALLTVRMAGKEGGGKSRAEGGGRAAVMLMRRQQPGELFGH